MLSVALVLVLLAAAASYGSWQVSQWAGMRQHSRATTFVLCGIVFLTSFALLAVVTATTWWKPLAQLWDFSPPMSAGADLHGKGATEFAVSSPVSVAEPSPQDWPATDCVKAVGVTDDAAGPRFIDNECERPVAVVFAWCERTQAACTANAQISAGWRYEPAGVLMTGSAQRLSPLRLGDDGPPVAATYVSRRPGEQRARVRYLACYVSAAEVLSLLDNPSDASTVAASQRHLQSMLSADDCYSRVARLSLAGQRAGKSPDAVLLDLE